MKKVLRELVCTVLYLSPNVCFKHNVVQSGGYSVILECYLNSVSYVTSSEMWQSNLNSERSGMLEEAFVTGIFLEKLKGRHSQRQTECLSLSKTQNGYVWNVCQSVWAEVVSLPCNRGSYPRSHWRGFSTASRPTQHPMHWQLGVIHAEVKRQGSEVDHSPPPGN